MSSAGRPPEPHEAGSALATPADAAWRRVAMFVLPGAAVLVAVLVLLGPGALRPALGARLYGAPAEGARVASLRVEIVSSAYGTVEHAGALGVEVEAAAPGQSLGAWRGRTDPEGIVEVSLPAGAPLRGPLAVRVVTQDPRPRLLAGGEIPLAPPPRARVEPTFLAGTTHGDLELIVHPTRGIFAAPFGELVRVAVSPPGHAELELSGPGLRITPEKLTTDERGETSFAVEALAHNVELTIAARSGGRSARWEGVLPVVPGALWLSRIFAGADMIEVRSPAPRDRAYVSFWTEQGRIAGAVVPLRLDVQGFHVGQVEVPVPADPAPLPHVLYATVAGDPEELGAGTVAWPLLPREGTPTFRPIGLLLDGLPAALVREEQRVWAARRAGLVLIGAAALAEVLLLLLMSRASQRRLEAHLVAASETMPEADRARVLGAARERPALRALLAVALVGLAFAMAAALSTFR